MKNNEYVNVLRVIFALAVLFLASSILSGIFGDLISWIGYYLSICGAIATVIASTIIIIIQLKNKKTTTISIILVLFTILFSMTTIFFSKQSFILLHNYTKVNKELKKSSLIKDYKYKVGDIYAKNYEKCGYVFNIDIDDKYNTKFQAAYCDCGTMWSRKCVEDNYAEMYKENFYNQYKKNNNITFKMKKKEYTKDDSLFSYEVEFIYDESNVKEYCEFVEEYNKDANTFFEAVKLEEKDCLRFKNK